MRNIKMEQKEKKLIITIDLGKPGELSASGKNEVIATTGGNVQVPGTAGWKVGLNVYKPNKDFDPSDD